LRRIMFFALCALLFVSPAFAAESGKLDDFVWRTAPRVVNADLEIFPKHQTDYVFFLAGKGDTRKIEFDAKEELIFTSRDENVVVVSEDGTITAVGKGDAIVTAERKGGLVLPPNKTLGRERQGAFSVEKAVIDVYVADSPAAGRDFGFIRSSRLNIVEIEGDMVGKDLEFTVEGVEKPENLIAFAVSNVFDGRLYIPRDDVVVPRGNGRFSAKLHKGMPTHVLIGDTKRLRIFGVYKFVPRGMIERTYFARPGEEKTDGIARQFVFEVEDGMRIRLPKIFFEPNKEWMDGTKTYRACFKTDYGRVGQPTFGSKFSLKGDILEVRPHKNSKSGDVYYIAPDDHSGAVIYIVVK